MDVSAPTLQRAFPALCGRTRLTAIFGNPVAHSLSPAIHNAAYAALGMERAYVAFEVKAEHLREAMRAVAALGILGVNLTVPHKVRSVRMLASASGEVRLMGAVNCVTNRRGRLLGDNTDARGLQMALENLGVALRAATVLVIGAGGGGAAAVLAALRLGAGRVVVANRTVAKARAIAVRLSVVASPDQQVEWCGLDKLADPALLGDVSAVVNATSVGLKGRRFLRVDYGATKPQTVFYDLIYASAPTPFMRPAMMLERRCFDGREMLLCQAALAFRLFNGIEPPIDAMRQALSGALDTATR